MQNRKDISALLIAGNEPHHHLQLKTFQRYLTSAARVPASRMMYISGQKKGNSQVLDLANEFVLDARRYREKTGTAHHLLVVYHGHGLREGFCPDGTPASYFSLVDTVGFDFPFLFVNSCCYAGQAIETFRDCKVLPSYGSVLASSVFYKPSYGAVFLDALVASWKEKQEFRRKKLYVVIHDDSFPVIQNDSPSSPRFRTYAQIPTRAGISLDFLFYPR